MRNRLISGMTLGTCVTEAPEQSGALITAHHAFEQGRDVFAVAGDMLTGRSVGTDALIRQGARLVTGAEEILEEYIPRFPDILNQKAASHIRSDPRFRTVPMETSEPSAVFPPAEEPHVVMRSPVSPALCPTDVSENTLRALSENARRVYSLLRVGPQPLGMLIHETKLPAPQVMIALTELEVAGCIRCLPGQAYALLTES